MGARRAATARPPYSRGIALLPRSMPDFLTAAFYKFVALPDYADLRAPLLACCEANAVKGTILLAPEGINSTIAGPEAGVRAVLAWLRRDARLADLQHKEAWVGMVLFYRMKVCLKHKIITLQMPKLNPTRNINTYIKPEH